MLLKIIHFVHNVKCMCSLYESYPFSDLCVFLHCAFVLLADCIAMLHVCILALHNTVLSFEFLSLTGNCCDKLCSLLVA